MNKLFSFIMLVLLFGCSQTASMKQLNGKVPIDEFQTIGNYRCLYYAGVELISQDSAESRWWQSVEPFTFYLNDDKKEGYLRQPHTVIKIKYISDNESMITRSTVMHTDNPDAYYIMELLKSNPCG